MELKEPTGQEFKSPILGYFPLAAIVMFCFESTDPGITKSAFLLFFYGVICTYLYRCSLFDHESLRLKLDGKQVDIVEMEKKMKKAASHAGDEQASLKKEIHNLKGKLMLANHFVQCMKDDAQMKEDPLRLRKWAPVKGRLFSVPDPYAKDPYPGICDDDDSPIRTRQKARAERAEKEARTLRSQIDDLEKKIADQDKKMEVREERMAKAVLHDNDRLADAEARNNGLEYKVLCLKNEVTRLESEVAHRSKAFKEVNDLNCQLSEKVLSLERGQAPAVEPLNRKIFSLEQEVEALRSADSAKKTQLKHLRSGASAMKKRFQSAAKKTTVKLTAKSRSLSAAQATYSGLLSTLESMTREVAEAKEEKNTIWAENVQLQWQLDDIKKSRADFPTENNTSSWYQKLEDLSKKFGRVSDEKSRFWAENMQLRGQLDEAAKKLQQAEEKRDVAEARELLEKKKRLEAEAVSDQMYDEKMEYEATLRQYDEDFEERLEEKKDDFDKKMDVVKKEAGRRKARLDAAELELAQHKETSRRELNKAKADLEARHARAMQEVEDGAAKEMTDLKRKHAAALRAATTAAATAQQQQHEASGMEVESSSAGGGGGEAGGKRMQVLESLVEALRESNRSMRAETQEAKKTSAKAAASEEEAAMLKRRLGRVLEDLSIEKKRRCDAQDALEAMERGRQEQG